MATSLLSPVNLSSPCRKLVAVVAFGIVKNCGALSESMLPGGTRPAFTAAMAISCFLKPGTELEARFSAISSCQRLLAVRAAAAWYKLTFIAGKCEAVNMPVSQAAQLQHVTK